MRMQWEMQYYAHCPINDSDLWTPLELLSFHDMLVKRKRKEAEAHEAARNRMNK